MLNHNTIVAVYNTDQNAQIAVNELRLSGFDMKKLSIIGREVQTEQDVIGYYNAGDRTTYWGKQGAFWGALGGLLLGAAFFLVPGVGPVLIAGPLAAYIASAVEGAVVVGGLSAIGAGLFSLGIPKDSILKYETAIKAGQYLVVVHGTADEAARATSTLSALKPAGLTDHVLEPSAQAVAR